MIDQGFDSNRVRAGELATLLGKSPSRDRAAGSDPWTTHMGYPDKPGKCSDRRMESIKALRNQFGC
jgi:hypothetical protein